MRRNFTSKNMTLTEPKNLLKTAKKLNFKIVKSGSCFSIDSLNKKTTDLYNFKSNLQLQGF